ncbi:MAG TPA: patatin-like phospholipase family protein [Firmicutes bacterium]|nr:patatin-like phospholipase family protein [Bacillota bacterium]
MANYPPLKSENINKTKTKNKIKFKLRAAALALLACLMLSGVFPARTIASAGSKPTVALVLGGGSAWGLSHIGLLKSLEENGVPVDLLVGTSMGSIVAGLYAAGYSVDNIIEIFTNLDATALLELPFPPGGGFIDTKGLQQYLDTLLDGKTYDQLNIPCYPVAVNLKTGAVHALNQGNVSTGIQASIAIPGVFPPVLIEDQYYADGGLKNQVAADVAADLGAEIIIAVYLKSGLAGDDYDDLGANVVRSVFTMVEGYVEENVAQADVLIEQEMDFDTFIDFHRVSYFVEQGYRAGNKAMPQIKAAILAYDPNFEFIPHRQAGYGPAELQRILKEAERAAAQVPKRFTIKPGFSFDHDYNFTKFEVKLTNGPFGRFGVGYRYGFDADNGGHEVFFDWGTKKRGHAGVFFRQSPNLDKPTYGISLKSPEFKEYVVEAVYLSQGDRAWRASLGKDPVFVLPWAVTGLSLDLFGLRQNEKNLPPTEKLMLGIRPAVKLFPWGERRFPFFPVLARPYFTAGVTVVSPLTAYRPQFTYEAGIGTDLLLFGLYPSSFSVGVQLDNEHKIRWQVELGY